MGADGKVGSVDVTSGGTGYTRGTVQFYPDGPAKEVGGTNLSSIGLNAVGSASTSIATFDVIIPQVVDTVETFIKNLEHIES